MQVPQSCLPLQFVNRPDCTLYTCVSISISHSEQTALCTPVFPSAQARLNIPTQYREELYCLELRFCGTVARAVLTWTPSFSRQSRRLAPATNVACSRSNVKSRPPPGQTSADDEVKSRACKAAPHPRRQEERRSEERSRRNADERMRGWEDERIRRWEDERMGG
eukprot:956982-Rhodomonas_salina.1